MRPSAKDTKKMAKIRTGTITSMWTLVTTNHLRVYIRVLEPVASRVLLGGLEYNGYSRFVCVCWSVMSLTPAAEDALCVCVSP